MKVCGEIHGSTNLAPFVLVELPGSARATWFVVIAAVIAIAALGLGA